MRRFPVTALLLYYILSLPSHWSGAHVHEATDGREAEVRPKCVLSSHEALVLWADSDPDNRKRSAEGIGECEDTVEPKDLAGPRVGQTAFGGCDGQFSGIGWLATLPRLPATRCRQPLPYA